MKKRLISLALTACVLLGLVPGGAVSAAISARAAERKAPEAPEALGAALPLGDTISAGAAHMAVIKEDGSLWAWGRNVDGRLGTGGAEEKVPAPVRVPVDLRPASVCAGADTTSVLTEDGELWNWGSDNWHGALGREIRGDRAAPGRALEGVRAFSAHGSHSAAITRDGTLWTWGRNSGGELGNGRRGTIVQGRFRSLTYEFVPTRVLERVRDVEAGIHTSFAILEDGTLWGWGCNEEGQLGNDTSVWREGEHEGSLLGTTETWTEVYEEPVTITSAFGTSITYRPGVVRECSSTFQAAPVKIMEDVAQVSAGSGGTAILKTDGSVWTCGGARELPDGRFTYAPRHVLDGAVQVSTDGSSYGAVLEDGSLWTWGSYAYGALGRETHSDAERETPAKIMDGVVSVSYGLFFAAALREDGSLWMWGSNLSGQLGVETESYYTWEPRHVMDGVALPQRARAGTLEEADAVPADPDRGALTAEDGGSAGWPDAVPQIPEGAVYIDGHAYSGYLAPYTWTEAKAYCESVGGHLATLTTQREIETLRFPQGPMFVGARRDGATGEFCWITGEAGKIGSSADPGLSCLCLQPDGSYTAVWDRYDKAVGFVCEWEAGGVVRTDTVTVTFDPNGGTISTASRKVAPGGPYGPLPIALRSGYTFTGWYRDRACSGAAATAETRAPQTDHTLYAGWAAAKPAEQPASRPSGGSAARPGTEVEDVSYSFGNNSRAFGYREDYKFPMARYTEMFGNSAAAATLYNKQSVWGGSCAGMVTSASWLYMEGGGGNNAQLTPRSTVTMSGSGKQYSLLELIELMQLIQHANSYQRVYSRHDLDYTALVTAVLDFRRSGTEPVIIALDGATDTPGKRSGHAVLGLDVRRDAANKKDVILIYDPNFPLDGGRWIDLYWSTPGEYTGWYYHTNDRYNWGSRYGSSYLTYAAYSDAMAVWEDRGSEAALSAGALYVNCENASVYDYAGNLAATIRDGEVESNRADIFPVQDPAQTGALSGVGSDWETGLWIPREYFTVVNDDADAGELSVAATGEESTLRVTTTGGRVMLCAGGDDDASVAVVGGGNARYEMLLTARGEEDVRLTGTTEEAVPACLARRPGSVSGMGVDGARLELGGRAASLDRVERTTAVSMVASTAPAVTSSVFPDVPRDADYAPAVQWAYDAGITGGTGAGSRFAPERPCTRGEALMLLWRALGSPEPAAGSVPDLPDVGEEDPWYRAVRWAAGTGVIQGGGDGRYRPREICTNGAFADLLWRALGRPEVRGELTGYDSGAAWAAGRGLLPAGTGDACRRRDAVEILYRALA